MLRTPYVLTANSMAPRKVSQHIAQVGHLQVVPWVHVRDLDCRNSSVPAPPVFKRLSGDPADRATSYKRDRTIDLVICRSQSIQKIP